MSQFATSYTPGGQTISLDIKVTIAYGPVHRFLVGNLKWYQIEAIAGRTLAEMADAEHQTQAEEAVPETLLQGWVMPPVHGR